MAVNFPANHYFQASSEEAKRAYALAAALELIAARASSAAPVEIEEELKNLSKYATLIQEGMKDKPKKK